MIEWPRMYFGPINLYSIPRQVLPHMYQELERKYCKGANKETLEAKRLEFNRLWNARADGG